MHLAAEQNLADIVELLLNYQVDVNKKNIEGYTALHYAVAGGDYYIVKQLLEQNAKIIIKDNEGLTALDIAFQYAVRDQKYDIFELLIKNGAPLKENINVNDPEIRAICKAAIFADDIYLNRIVPTRHQYIEHARYTNLIQDRLFYYTDNIQIYGAPRSPTLVRDALNGLKKLSNEERSFVNLISSNDNKIEHGR